MLRMQEAQSDQYQRGHQQRLKAEMADLALPRLEPGAQTKVKSAKSSEAFAHHSSSPFSRRCARAPFLRGEEERARMYGSNGKTHNKTDNRHRAGRGRGHEPVRPGKLSPCARTTRERRARSALSVSWVQPCVREMSQSPFEGRLRDRSDRR